MAEIKLEYGRDVTGMRWSSGWKVAETRHVCPRDLAGPGQRFTGKAVEIHLLFQQVGCLKGIICKERPVSADIVMMDELQDSCLWCGEGVQRTIG